MVGCPVCGQEVNWVTVSQAADVLGVSDGRILQFIKQGRLPNSQKHRPKYGMQTLWKIPIPSLMALHQMRRKEQGLNG